MQHTLPNMKLMPSDLHILLDENIPFEFILFFEKAGCITEHLKKIGKTGIRNGEVYTYAEEKKSWIVTRDADFQSLYKFEKYKIGGVILFKTTQSKTQFLLKTVKRFWELHSTKLTKKLLIVIEDDEVKFME